MSIPLLMSRDPEMVATDAIHALTQTVPDLSGWTVGTRIPAGVTPRRHIRVRCSDQDQAGVLLDRPTLTLQVWGDGEDGESGRIARLLAAHLRRDLRCRRLSGPVHLPDPVTPGVNLSQLSIQLFLKGEQS